jgi:hypothetical protein
MTEWQERMLREMNEKDALEPQRCREDLYPVSGPMPPLALTNVSPSAEENFRYVSERNPDVRAILRKTAFDLAIKKAADLPPPAVPEAEAPVDFEGFQKSQLHWSRPLGSPFELPEEDISRVDSYLATESTAAEGLPIFRQDYVIPGGINSSRYIISVDDRILKFSSNELAEAILFLRAQDAGDPRVTQDRADLSYGALVANGEHTGHGFTCYAFPGLKGLWLRVHQRHDGFCGPFDETVRFASPEETLAATYEQFIEAITPAAPANAPC